LTTFKDQQKKLTDCQHKLAVWEFLYAHLDTNYISKDGRNVEKALRVPDCLVELVPEDAVEDILKFISEGPIAEFQGSIDAIENQVLGTEELENGTSGKQQE
jgi:hypothetical protein